ncbi:MAG TPA: sugar transferase [Candidatus Binatia bacterium]|nr:sugar transferase [Candidatus Binatia bacterium]
MDLGSASRVVGAMALDQLRAAELTEEAMPAVRPAQPMFDLRGHDMPVVHLALKRCIDVVGSGVLLLLLSPLLALVALLVAADGGPAFFSQPRVGQHGRTFRCWKFRSMVTDAEAALVRILEKDPVLCTEWEWGQKLRHDPRITPIGRLIRKASIDELPQLWNVFTGDMSLVGPRPVMLSQLNRYGRDAKWYTAMRPGITGLWQVTARGDGDFQRRVELDCAYVKRYRFHTDFFILLKTVAVVLTGRGAM